MRYKAMKKIIAFCFVVVCTLAGASETDTEKFELDNGYILYITETTHSRNMPYVFYDQAIDSIPRIHPNSIIVAKRRLGIIGKNAVVLYSLIGYKEEKDSKKITLSGIATYRDRAWSFNIIVADSSLTQTLLLVLENLSNLPYNKRMQSDLQTATRFASC